MAISSAACWRSIFLTRGYNPVPWSTDCLRLLRADCVEEVGF